MIHALVIIRTVLTAVFAVSLVLSFIAWWGSLLVFISSGGVIASTILEEVLDD